MIIEKALTNNTIVQKRHTFLKPFKATLSNVSFPSISSLDSSTSL